MSWIKRNLYFVIGAVIAVILLGVAGWYFYSKWSLNNKNLDQLNQAYSDLVGFNKQSPHPGSGTTTQSNIVPTDANGIAYSRTTGQVLNVVYLNKTAVTSGGFYPAGLNGAIK